MHTRRIDIRIALSYGAPFRAFASSWTARPYHHRRRAGIRYAYLNYVYSTNKRGTLQRSGIVNNPISIKKTALKSDILILTSQLNGANQISQLIKSMILHLSDPQKTLSDLAKIQKFVLTYTYI